jgi:hypothetical protein
VMMIKRMVVGCREDEGRGEWLRAIYAFLLKWLPC